MKCKKFWKQNSSILLTFVVAAALLAFVSIVKPGYSNPANLKVLSISVAVLGFTALGQTFSILTGGMDLSVPWIFCIGGYLCAMLTGGENAKLIYAVPAVLLVGALMGAVNGFGIAYVGIAPVIMTMASNIIYQGLLVGFTGGTPGGSHRRSSKIWPPAISAAYLSCSCCGLSSRRPRGCCWTKRPNAANYMA